MYTLFYNVRLYNNELRTKMHYFTDKHKMQSFLDSQKAKYIVSDVAAYDKTTKSRMREIV